jgi:intracellular multiplication protein IcmT
MRHPDTAHWRDSARTPKFFFLDAFSAIPLLVFLLHIRLWSFILAVSIALFFAILNRFGFSLPVFLRLVRSTFAGKQRSAHSWYARKIE